MKVSVITVVKNASSTVLDTLASVRQQDHPDIEHIIVDGGSSDGTVELINREAGEHVKVIMEPDRGVYEGFNRGISAATGDIVGFLNGDDVFQDSGALRTIVEMFEKGTINAVYGDLVYVRSNDLSRVVRYWQAGTLYSPRVRRGWMPPHPTLYVRRQLLKKVGFYDARFRISGDYEYFLRLIQCQDLHMGYIPRVLVRMRTGGMSNWPPTNYMQKWREDLRALRLHGIGGIGALFGKNLRKLPQLFRAHPHQRTTADAVKSGPEKTARGVI